MKARHRSEIIKDRPIVRQAVHLWNETSGGTAIEYGLIAALIALAILGSLIQLRESLLGLPMQALIDAFVGAVS